MLQLFTGRDEDAARTGSNASLIGEVKNLTGLVMSTRSEFRTFVEDCKRNQQEAQRTPVYQPPFTLPTETLEEFEESEATLLDGAARAYLVLFVFVCIC